MQNNIIDTRPLIALTIWQPWAYLIVMGLKDIENRDWHTNFRGRVFVHAGKTVDKEAHEYINAEPKLYGLPADFKLPPLSELPQGGVVGLTNITDCVTESPSPWFFGKHGFKLSDSKPMDFVPVRGERKFFELKGYQYDAAKNSLDIIF